MKLTRIISLILAALMCLTFLASCAGGDEPIVITNSGNDTGSDEGFVDADYEQEDFTFLYIKHSDVGKDYYGGDYIYAETYTGDTISDAVYARNLAVEEKYNVKINQLLEVNGDPAALIQKKIMSGEFDHDVIYGWAYKLGACIPENFFADFNQLSNVDFTQDYWSPSAMEDLTINDKLYLCINDISMNKLEWADLIFYNKNIAEDYNINTEFGSFYDLVNDGKWTLDVFLKMVQSVSNDLNGDGIIGKDDVFGMLDGSANGSWAAACSDVQLTTKNDDGSYSLSFYNEKLLGIIDKIYPVYSNNKYVKDYDDIWSEGGVDGNGGYSDQWEYARSFFTTDHSLFCTGSAYITSEFRNMTSSYGIIPFPKYDENQENYYAGVSCLASIFALPATVRNDVSTAGMERTGTILEYMAYKSNEILLPDYYETLLKGQRLDTEEDSQMLDIIRSSVRYQFSATVGIESVGELLDNMFAKPTTATSTYKRSEKKLQKALDDYYSEVIMLDSKNNTTEK
ncbi:MAG: hypothetical protein PUC29_04300 [Clostridia bacterium]|nr:hypothetical protein [Clostridia bacterium]